MKKETQETISQWAEETFGPVGSNASVAARANQEMSELLRALTSNDDNPGSCTRDRRRGSSAYDRTVLERSSRD